MPFRHINLLYNGSYISVQFLKVYNNLLTLYLRITSEQPKSKGDHYKTHTCTFMCFSYTQRLIKSKTERHGYVLLALRLASN